MFMGAHLTTGVFEDVFQALGHPSDVRVVFLAALHAPADHLLDPQQSTQQVI